MFSIAVHSKSIYLTRHAEKIDDGSKDPVLTIQGEIRAKNIADMLSEANIQHVYSTDYQRTQLTAKPLAQFLGLTVKSYNPNELASFAQQLKQQSGNALVVGHSNTTPMLTYLLSGQAVNSLDESDFDNIYQVMSNDDQVILTKLKSSPSTATNKPTDFKPLHDNYFEGELVFNSLYKGEVVGESKYSYKAKKRQYILHQQRRVESLGIKVDSQISVEQETLKPIKLSTLGSKEGPVDIAFKWYDDVVKGYSKVTREPFKAQGQIDLNKHLHTNTFERISVNMMAHLMPVSEHEPILMNWFDGQDGSQRLVQIKNHGREQITVPAGTFDTNKVEYLGGTPSRYYWIDINQPKIVKVELIKSPWAYELASFKIQ